MQHIIKHSEIFAYCIPNSNTDVRMIYCIYLIVEICSSPCIDGVFVLDVSKSIGNRKIGEGPFNLMKNLMINTFSLVTFSPNCSRAGLILFASDAKIEFNLTAHADKNSLQKALNGLNLKRLKKFRMDTGTNTAEGLNLLKNVAQNGNLGVNKEDRVKIAVIITDGRPSPSKAQQKEGVMLQDAMKLTLDARDALIKDGIYDHIYAIGVQGKDKKPIDKNTLTIIASNNESAFLLNNFTTDEFEEVTENIQFCNRELALSHNKHMQNFKNLYNEKYLHIAK